MCRTVNHACSCHVVVGVGWVLGKAFVLLLDGQRTPLGAVFLLGDFCRFISSFLNADLASQISAHVR
jgi:hypothetical protein